MVSEDIINDTLGYLKKEGPTNTFRLAREIGLERYKLLIILKRLEEKQAIKFERGLAIFLKFPSEEKPKPTKIKKTSPKPKKKIKRKPKDLQLLQTKNKQLKEKLLELEETIKELEKKASARPKTITKTIIKKIPVTKTVVKEVPVPPLPKKKKEKEKNKEKLPKFSLMKYIKKLKKPEFVK